MKIQFRGHLHQTHDCMPLKFEDKDAARRFFQTLTQAARDWNQIAFDTDEFKKQEEKLDHQIAEVTRYE